MGLRHPSDTRRKSIYRRTDFRTDRAAKGTPTQPGGKSVPESSYRRKPRTFQKMNSGEIEEGAMVLRAKIDMANPNMHFRDPIIYRVVKTPAPPHRHHMESLSDVRLRPRTKSDFFEGSYPFLCTLRVRCAPPALRSLHRLVERREKT